MFGDHNSHFSKYSRKNHRYKLGKQALIDALMLSSTDVLLFTTSNLWRFSIVLSKKKENNIKCLLKLNLAATGLLPVGNGILSIIFNRFYLEILILS